MGRCWWWMEHSGKYSVMIFSLFAYNGQKERHSPMHCGNWPRVSISGPICLSAFYVIVNTKSHCLPPVHGTLSLCIRMGLLNRTFSSVKNGSERAKPCLLRITKNRGEIRTLSIQQVGYFGLISPCVFELFPLNSESPLFLWVRTVEQSLNEYTLEQYCYLKNYRMLL